MNAFCYFCSRIKYEIMTYVALDPSHMVYSCSECLSKTHSIYTQKPTYEYNALPLIGSEYMPGWVIM